MEFFPPHNSLPKETEKEINHSIDVAITRQQEAQNKPQSDLEKFYSNIKSQSKVPLDPLFQDYIQQIMDDNIYWTQKLEDIKSNQQTMVDYEIVHSLIQTISNAAAEAPREYRQLSSSLPKMEEETTQIYEQEIPQLLKEFTELTMLHRSLLEKANNASKA